MFSPWDRNQNNFYQGKSNYICVCFKVLFTTVSPIKLWNTKNTSNQLICICYKENSFTIVVWKSTFYVKLVCLLCTIVLWFMFIGLFITIILVSVLTHFTFNARVPFSYLQLYPWKLCLICMMNEISMFIFICGFSVEATYNFISCNRNNGEIRITNDQI